ncbi:hypothetical protein [Garciella nitratireducens]|uniref:hypothetical protein n=1 Tax=Garciella nitratireducens TaxID=218205 RepID=UPI001FA81CB9|nr:hypothetical protein [Garciella nitratireducens]
MEFVLVHFIIMNYIIGMSIWKTLRNVLPTAISAIAMGILGYFLQQVNDSLIWSFISIIK